MLSGWDLIGAKKSAMHPTTLINFTAFAVELINKGLAYVCDLSPEQAREYRGNLTQVGKNSPHRERSIEENLDLFARMKAGEFADGDRVLRAKIDNASPNMNMRDPIIYRIRHIEHHQTGNQWCIYPMYDFTHGLSDALEQVTHSICTLEFEDHRPLYDWFIDHVTLPSGSVGHGSMNLHVWSLTTLSPVSVSLNNW